MKNFLKTASMVALISGLGLAATTAPAMAEAGDLLVRLRGIHVSPSASADITAIGGDADIDTATVPELDFTYFISDKFAAELILATTKHNATAVGTALGDVDLGSVYLLPPTLTFQYHPMAGEKISPYIGAGINYTMFYKSKEPAAVVTDIAYKNKFGLAAQAGIDFWVNDNYFLNIDVKKVWLGTDVTINGGAITADVDINPTIWGIGFGTKF